MPRDINGNYTLPAGNPVVSGTPISATVQNNTTGDIATALTDSLSRSGKGGMLAPLPFGDGTAGNPSITFTNELTTGIYRNGAGEWNIAILGQKVLTVADDGVYSEQDYWQWNVGLAAYVALVNAGDDYTINGSWDFTQEVAAVNFRKTGKGLALCHNDATLPSSMVFVSATAPTGPEGADGDIWLQLEP